MPADNNDILSKAALDVLSGDKQSRVVIPADIRQKELARVGEIATSAAEFPASGETATLTFPGGKTEEVKVNGYDRRDAQPNVQIGVGSEKATQSNMDMGAFRDLTAPKQ